ncbi:MAG: PSD1 domain-containing protein [Bryobacterales bacterium]|nr:PSD1 domain-containing protein [Bryobacterales bacterium]
MWLRILALFAATSAVTAAADPAQLYLDVVKPALEQQCLGCHGVGNTFAKLDLRTRESALRGGGRGPALVPGNPDASLLYAASAHAGELQMPPGGAEKKLPAETLAAMRAWIEGGAPFPSGQTAQKWDYDEADVWAFQPLRDIAPPTQGVDPARVRTPVDAFLLARLAEEGLQPGELADKLTLIRRVTYDLTGLPPTPEQVQAFLEDSSAGAYKDLVERLLASPEYGERWGRHWLDVTRYADTSGYSNDFERPNAWRYRDYVIRSFNQDKPYDRFVMEQIAGDELWPDDPEAVLATGFLRAGPWEHTGMSVAAVTRQLFLDDVTHAVGQTFLGLTLGCARCHDHKFDPIPTKDYYSMQAVFATTAFARRPLAFEAVESTEEFEHGRRRYEEMIAAIEERIEGLHEQARRKLAETEGEEAARTTNPGALLRNLDQEQAELLKLFRKHISIHQESIERYDPKAFAVSSGLVKEWNDVGPQGANSYLTADDYESPETHVLVGGDVQAPGEEVSPGVLQAVARYSGFEAPNIPETTSGRRAALAKWVADPRNPLTARVMVNRIWQYHFGRGLADNANNFGKMGKRPTHPELLDWLAGFFIRQGWSVKAVHRVILYSDAYQRASAKPDEKDAQNRLLAVFSPRRLEAEELRDTLLAISGEMSPRTGGPGTYQQINSEVARQPRHAMGSLQPPYLAAPRKRNRNRRTIYTFQQRSLIDPMVETFNGANPDLTCERREASVVPTQAFVLLNSEVSHDLALAMATRVEKEASTPEERIERTFRLTFGRAPTKQEEALAVEHLRAMTAVHAEHPAAPPKPEPSVVHTITSELTGEQFQFTQPEEVVDFERNLHPSEVGPQTRALADLALALMSSNELVYVY